MTGARWSQPVTTHSSPWNLGRGLVVLGIALPGCLSMLGARVWAADLTLELETTRSVRLVGAMRRWDADGNPVRPVDPQARIEAPHVDATGRCVAAGRWLLSGLEPGRYDLVILADDRLRVEGFSCPPVREFDPFLDPDVQAPATIAATIGQKIAADRHYENKVTPLFFVGQEPAVRVLLQLLRDEPTSFDAEFGRPVATLRHELWQYTFRYGAWSKEKRTRVLDRVILSRDDLRRWTWLWDPHLGNIEVTDAGKAVHYVLPNDLRAGPLRGLLPMQ
jgi:hypothetical protein